jgi:hypothetical protein
MSDISYISKAALAHEKQRTDRANRGLVSVIQHLMKELGLSEVTIPIAELSEKSRVSIVADNDRLVVSLQSEDDPH